MDLVINLIKQNLDFFYLLSISLLLALFVQALYFQSKDSLKFDIKDLLGFSMCLAVYFFLRTLSYAFAENWIINFLEIINLFLLFFFLLRFYIFPPYQHNGLLILISFSVIMAFSLVAGNGNISTVVKFVSILLSLFSLGLIFIYIKDIFTKFLEYKPKIRLLMLIGYVTLIFSILATSIINLNYLEVFKDNDSQITAKVAIYAIQTICMFIVVSTTGGYLSRFYTETYGRSSRLFILRIFIVAFIFILLATLAIFEYSFNKSLEREKNDLQNKAEIAFAAIDKVDLNQLILFKDSSSKEAIEERLKNIKSTLANIESIEIIYTNKDNYPEIIASTREAENDLLAYLSTKEISASKEILVDSNIVSMFYPFSSESGNGYVRVEIPFNLFSNDIYQDRRMIILVFMFIITAFIVSLTIALRFTFLREKTELVKEEFKRIFDSTNDSIFVLKGNQIVNANLKATKKFGLTLDELKGKTLFDFSEEKQDIAEFPEKFLNLKIDEAMNNSKVQFEWKFKRRIGLWFYAEVNIIKYETDLDQFLQVIIRDITSRKKIESEEKEHIKELERLNKIMVGRELKMINLKKEINRLKQNHERRSK